MTEPDQRKPQFPAGEGFRALRRVRLHQEIAGQIEDLVAAGRLRPGAPLPPERELAKVFGVSRHSVREALRTLEEKGILTSRPGSGTYVAAEDETSVGAFLARTVLGQRDKLKEIFQFRRLLEPEVAALAAENAAPEEISGLEEILSEQASAGQDLALAARLDQRFHLLLAQASGNGILLKIVDQINDILSESRSEALQSPERRQGSLQDHRRLAAALKARDPQAARLAMLRHLENIEAIVFKKEKDHE